MAFPVSPLDVTVELQSIVSDGVWTDVTEYVYTENGIAITRGRSDEASGLEPSRCSLVFDNRDGRFSPRNPTGAYYGRIGRNTPVRVSTKTGAVRLVCPTNSDYPRTPDSAGLSITGDIDLRVDADLPDWTTGDQLITKFQVVGQASYILETVSDGTLAILWSPTGSGFLSAQSTVPLPRTTGRQAVRATLDVNNGAGGRTITFYYADTMAGPWVQLGDTVVQAGTTSIFDSTSLVAGPLTSNSEVYSLKILSGINGVERANPDFTAQSDGTTSFVDAAGNTWTLNGSAALTNRRYRFYGEISAWPQSWDLSGNDVRVAVEAAGVLRRLAQGADPVQGTIYRATLTDTSVRGYWPVEDEDGATSIASALPGGRPMTYYGTPSFAESDVFEASNPVAVMAGASFTGAVSTYTSTGTIHARCLMAVPSDGESDDTVVMRVFTTGTAARWDFILNSDGGLVLKAYDSLGSKFFEKAVGFRVNGVPCVLVLELVQNGSGIDYKMLTVALSDGLGLQWTGTVSSRTVGAATVIQINPNYDLSETAIGHIAVASAVPSYELSDVFRGYAGETAGRRVERLCSEQGIDFTAYGDLDQSEPMGVQTSQTLLDLLAECELADLGQVFESRGGLGLAYRTRDSRQYQAARLALAYGNLAELTPIEDDQSTRNDITVTRPRGSSARVTADTGPLSTQAPPNGVGRYSEEIEVNVETDDQLADQAQWRVTEGTVDEPRYPSIVVHLESGPFADSEDLTTAALAVDHGDLITVSDPPEWLPPGAIRQHTVGQTETLGPFEYSIEFVCVPATPYGSAGTYNDDARYAPSGSTLTSTITSSATSLSITTAAGNPLWTTDSGDFPLDILVGGEQITLSAISGTASPQTATVSARSVNGVVKAQSAGSAIDIASPVYYTF